MRRFEKGYKMAFFSRKETCGVCGKEVGLNRYKIAMDNAWCCPQCLKQAQKNGNCTVNVTKITIDGLKKLIEGGMEALEKDNEYRKKCNVCGHIFCYSDSDIYRNKQLAKSARSSANMAVMEALGGTRLAGNQQIAAAERSLDKIIDYSRCPKCNSSELTDATEEEIRQANSNNGSNNSTVSSADELKKFKELLDAGIITQEEFDAKKKQILGL